MTLSGVSSEEIVRDGLYDDPIMLYYSHNQRHHKIHRVKLDGKAVVAQCNKSLKNYGKLIDLNNMSKGDVDAVVASVQCSRCTRPHHFYEALADHFREVV